VYRGLSRHLGGESFEERGGDATLRRESFLKFLIEGRLKEGNGAGEKSIA